MKMFEIDRKLVKIRSVTNVPEFKGEKREHACSVKIEYQTDNMVLDVLEPGLRKAFYEKDNGKTKTDPEGQAELSLPRGDLDLTQRRLDMVHMPLKLKKEMAGYRLVYHCGASEKSEIKLAEVGLSDFTVDLQPGGTTVVVFNSYSKPGAEVQGRIDHMAQTEVEISLLPPEEKQPELAPTASKGRKKKTAAEVEGSEDDPFAGSDLARGAKNGPPAKEREGSVWPFPKEYPQTHSEGEPPIDASESESEGAQA